MLNVFKRLLANLGQLPSTIFHFVVVFLAALFKFPQRVGASLKRNRWHNQRRVVGNWFLIIMVFSASIAVFETPAIHAHAQTQTSQPVLIHDSQFYTDYTFLQQEIQTFLNKQSGILKSYPVPYYARTETVAEAVMDTSLFDQVSPQVLLVLVELQSGLVTNPSPTTMQLLYPMSLPSSRGFLDELDIAAKELLSYAHNYSTTSNLTFKDGSTIAASPNLNRGSYAIQAFLAHYNTQADWTIKVGNTSGSFTSVYTAWFGDPTIAKIKISPKTISNPSFPSLPWLWGGNGVITQHYHDTNNGGIDFVANTDSSGNRPVAPIADGVVIASKTNGGNCEDVNANPADGNFVLVEYTGTFSGWYGWYYHLAVGGVYVTSGNVSAGSTELGIEGHTGDTNPCNVNGTHLHLQFVKDPANAYTYGGYDLSSCSPGTVEVNGNNLCGNIPTYVTLTNNQGNSQLPQGDYNDYTCSNGLRGWAWDPKAPNTSINVDMYADGNGYINTTLANIYRSDVQSIVSHDNGDHGFLIPIPASIRDGKTHTIHIYAINTNSSSTNPEISDSPTTITCPAVPQGSFDSVSCTTIWGWAWDPKAPNVSINVHLYDGSTIVGGYTANVYRSDVASAVSHDNGLHGFSIPFPDSLRDGKVHMLHIFAINTDSTDLNPEIAQSPKTIQCAIPAPSAPSYLALGPIGLNQISISWTNTADNATGIYVERKTGANGTYTRIATLAANVNSYQDNGLSPATNYYYRVQAYNSSGTSAYSNEVNATTPAARPNAPTNLIATAASYNQINLSWANNANNATGVSIERKTGANGTYNQITTLTANATSYQDTGLSPATTYYYRIQADNATGNSDYSNEVNATTAPLYTYHLPYVANNGAGINGNYTTNVTLQNMGSAPANFTITYYDNGGSTLATDNDNGGTLAPNTKYNASGLASGQSGAATIVSTQPLSIVVSESGTFNGQAIASSYPDINTTTGVGTTIYAPIALNHSYGAFSTGFVLRNAGTSDTTVTIQYYNDYGNPAGSQNVTIKAEGSMQVLQSDATANLPSNFSGWASITSNNGQPLAGIDVETNPSTGFVATVACTATPGKTVYVPVVFQNAFGNFITGMQLVNPNGMAANVTVKYYRKDGTLMQVSSDHASFQIPAHGDKSFFHSSQVFPELLTANGGFVGTAIITSDQPLLSMVNQMGSVGSVNFNGSFGTLLNGTAQVNMPSVFKNASAYSSGLQIVNTSSTASTATVTYYDANGNKVYQTDLTADDGGPIKPGGSINPYQGSDNNLPNGFSGTAVITADTSGANFVVVGNISDGKIFYTYAEPN